MKALEVRGLSRDDLPYKAPFQPWGAWLAFVSTGIITLFKGFDTFLPWNAANFVTYAIFRSILHDNLIILLQELHCNPCFLYPLAHIQAYIQNQDD